MTNSRTLIARFAMPLAATALLLTACGSSTASGDAEPAAASSVAAEVAESAASDDMAESDDMTQSDDTAATESDAMASEPAAAASGAYITLVEYEGSKDMYAGGDVVLFFAADWCSTCQEATENLEADPAAIPAGLAIVRVDYDDSDELKQKYGVTVQHTFVQVDAEGNEIAKWSGSVTADQIAKQTA